MWSRGEKINIAAYVLEYMAAEKNTLINREMNKYWSILWCLKILTKNKILIILDTWLVADWNEILYLRSNEIIESEL